jgi:hypothetical protein
MVVLSSAPIRLAMRFALAGALAAAWAAPLRAQAAVHPGRAQQTPEAFARRYVATLVAGDFAANARLMHPQALGTIRRFVTVLAERDSTGQAVRQLLGVERSGVAALTDEQVYERFLRTVVGSQPEFLAAMRKSRTDIIGHVDEGTDQTHVLYRLHLEVQGIRLAKIDVLTAKRVGGEWRAMLTGDIEGLIARLSTTRDS